MISRFQSVLCVSMCQGSLLVNIILLLLMAAKNAIIVKVAFELQSLCF